MALQRLLLVGIGVLCLGLCPCNLHADGSAEQTTAYLHKIKKQALAEKKVQYDPSVQRLAELIKTDGVVRLYLTKMMHEVPKQHRVFDDTETLLKTVNYIIKRAPDYQDGEAFPISAVFAQMMYTPSGVAGFRNEKLNAALRDILKQWCQFLDSKESLAVINKENGWLSPPAWKKSKLDDFIVPEPNAPHGGFQSFNDFFHRKIKPQLRPIASPDNPKIIVSANDGTVYNLARDVKKQNTFWIKSQPYSLLDMLDNSKHVDRFVGGDVFQSFLSGSDYHRFHAPITGTVRQARVVEGLMFSELRSAGFDTTGGTLSQAYQAAVNTRGLIFIESDDKTLGMVAVIPIGITEVSSVTLTVKPGQKVKKGDQVGYFSYGGSSLCLVFQPGAIKKFSAKPPAKFNGTDGDQIKVNAQIAEAN